MKKVMTTSLAAVAVAGMIGGGTFAGWTDTQTTSGAIDAGVLTLTIDEEQSSASSFVDMVPGGSETFTRVLAVNDGESHFPSTDLTSELRLSVDNVVQSENGCGGDEATVDTLCSTETTEAELWDALEVERLVLRSVNGSGTCSPSVNPPLAQLATPSSPLPLSSLDADLGDYAPGEDVCITYQIGLPFSTGNETQTDGVTFDFVWTLTQLDPDA